MTTIIECWVPGTPSTQGSKRYFRSKSGKTIGVEDNKRLPGWRSDVRNALDKALQEYKGDHEELAGLYDSPVYLTVTFYFERPKSHFGTGRNREILKPGTPKLPVTKSDLDKLLRAVLDAATKYVFRDDKQVVTIVSDKQWANDHGPGARLAIIGLDS